MLQIEFRDHAHAPWKRSAMAWTVADIGTLNRLCGYEKYRIVKVIA